MAGSPSFRVTAPVTDAAVPNGPTCRLVFHWSAHDAVVLCSAIAAATIMLLTRCGRRGALICTAIGWMLPFTLLPFQWALCTVPSSDCAGFAARTSILQCPPCSLTQDYLSVRSGGGLQLACMCACMRK